METDSVDKLQKAIKVYIPKMKNAGDLFNHDLLNFFHLSAEIVNRASDADLLMLGGVISSLQNDSRQVDDSPLHVWGSGFLFGDDLHERLCRPNLMVHALRGRLSKE